MKQPPKQLISRIKSWETCSKVQDSVLKRRVACLIGTSIQAHTNRTKHLWSIHSSYRKGDCIAYADGLILLKDVKWLPAKNRAAQDTFFPDMVKGSDGSGKRTVQAFAEGTLIYARNRAGKTAYGIEGIDAILDDIANCDQERADYNPFRVGALKYFRDESSRALFSSDYAILEYYVCEETNKVRHSALAVCGKKYFDVDEAQQQVDLIESPDTMYLKKRFGTSENYQSFIDGTRHGAEWFRARQIPWPRDTE